MAQVFVPSAGLNLQQGMAQQGARVDTGLVNQVSPVDNLKPLNQALDAISKDLGQWDKMNISRDALERFDNLQQQLSSNSDELQTKKGKAAIDFYKTYEQRNKDIFAKAMDDVKDFRVRNAIHANSKRMYDGYVERGQAYLTQETAAANLNQAKASLSQAVSNYIEQDTTGTPEQQRQAKLQVEDTQALVSGITGLDPNGVDGQQALKKTYDLIHVATNKHLITHKAFATANQKLDAAKSQMNFETYLEEKDKIYLAQEKEAALNKASSSGFKLPERGSWVKSRAEDIVNADEQRIMAEHPEVIKSNPNWRQERFNYALAQANLEFDDIVTKNKAASDTDAAMHNLVTNELRSAAATGRIYSPDGQGAQISAEVLRDNTNILGRLSPDAQNWAIGKWGSVDKANQELYKLQYPRSAVSAGNSFQLVSDWKTNPTGFYEKYPDEVALRADLFNHGVGADDLDSILKGYKSEQDKLDLASLNNASKLIISSVADSSLSDDKKVKADPNLAMKKAVYEKAIKRARSQIKKANPNLTDTELTSRTMSAVQMDTSIPEEINRIDQIQENAVAYQEFDTQLKSYNPTLLKAVQAFNPTEFESCFGTDYIVGLNRLKKLVKDTLENKNFQHQHPHAKEVINTKKREQVDNLINNSPLLRGR